MIFILFSLIIFSNSSILDYIAMPNRYSNCLADYLTEEECQSVNGEWKEIEPLDCENKDFSSDKTKIGICCNMKCLTGNGIIKVEMETKKVCNFVGNAQDFFGFKNYKPFNNAFLNVVGYYERNKEFTVFQKLTQNNDDFLSVYCSFPTKEKFLIGLTNIMEEKFDYISGAGHKNGPDEKVVNETTLIGFDCTRLVMFLIDKISDFEFNFSISSEQLYDIAVKNNLVKSSDDLKIGDIMFNKNLTENKIYHSAVYIGDNKKFHAPGKGKKVKKGNANYIPETDIILVADFINLKKNSTIKTEETIISTNIEGDSKEVHGFSNTEESISSTIIKGEIKEVDNFAKINKINISFLLGLFLFIL